jgi:hypothetical protein
MITAFFFIHVYLTTTGHTVFAHIKAMITGWEDAHDDGPATPERPARGARRGLIAARGLHSRRPAAGSARGVFVRKLVTVGDVGRPLHHEHDEGSRSPRSNTTVQCRITAAITQMSTICRARAVSKLASPHQCRRANSETATQAAVPRAR